MSIEALALALHHSQSKGTDKLVLIGICNHDGDGGAWPSHDTLAKYANCSVSRVKQAIRHLAEFGEITVQVNAGGDQNTRADRRPNLYEIHLECPEDCDRSKKHRSTGVTTSTTRQAVDGGQKSEPRGAEMTPTGGSTSSQEPSITKPSDRTSRRSLQANAGDDVAKRWWTEQVPRPAGKGAWWSTLNACRAVADAGWEPDQIYAALNRIGGVPSVARLDLELRRPRMPRETNRDRQIREGVELARRQAQAEDASTDDAVVALFSGPRKAVGR